MANEPGWTRTYLRVQRPMTLDKRWKEATVIVGAGSALEWEWIRFMSWRLIEQDKSHEMAYKDRVMEYTGMLAGWRILIGTVGLGCDGKPVQPR